MNRETSTAGYWNGAQNAFRYAIVESRFGHGVKSLSLVGRAVLSTTIMQDKVIPEGLRRLMVQHPEVVRGAAGVLGVRAEMYGHEAIADILYARSGYQALLDAGLWAQPPVDSAEVEEMDEEIREMARTVEFPAEERRPEAVPPEHDWWPEPLRNGDGAGSRQLPVR